MLVVGAHAGKAALGVAGRADTRAIHVDKGLYAGCARILGPALAAVFDQAFCAGIVVVVGASGALTEPCGSKHEGRVAGGADVVG